MQIKWLIHSIGPQQTNFFGLKKHFERDQVIWSGKFKSNYTNITSLDYYR